MLPTKKFALIALRILVTGLSLYWLFTLADFKTVAKTFTTSSVTAIAAAVGLALFTFLIGSLRWWMLLRHSMEQVSYIRILPSYYLGIFFNNILPTTMGGDAARVVHLGLRGISIKALVSSSIMDRGIGLFVILGMGAISIGLSQDSIDTHDKMLLAATTAATILGAGLLFNTSFHAFILRISVRYHHTRIRRLLLETLQLCHSYKSAPGKLIGAVGLTVVMQSSIIVSYYILGKTTGIMLPLLTYFAVIPLVFLAGAIPISIGGIGVREGALVGLLTAVGVDTQMAIALSLLFLLALIVSSLPGGLVILFGQKNKK